MIEGEIKKEEIKKLKNEKNIAKERRAWRRRASGARERAAKNFLCDDVTCLARAR